MTLLLESEMRRPLEQIEVYGNRDSLLEVPGTTIRTVVEFEGPTVCLFLMIPKTAYLQTTSILAVVSGEFGNTIYRDRDSHRLFYTTKPL